jgi:hypothetical protein
MQDGTLRTEQVGDVPIILLVVLGTFVLMEVAHSRRGGGTILLAGVVLCTLLDDLVEHTFVLVVAEGLRW